MMRPLELTMTLMVSSGDLFSRRIVTVPVIFSLTMRSILAWRASSRRTWAMSSPWNSLSERPEVVEIVLTGATAPGAAFAGAMGGSMGAGCSGRPVVSGATGAGEVEGASTGSGAGVIAAAGAGVACCA